MGEQQADFCRGPEAERGCCGRCAHGCGWASVLLGFTLPDVCGEEKCSCGFPLLFLLELQAKRSRMLIDASAAKNPSISSVSVWVSSLSADVSRQGRKTNELCSGQNWQRRAELPAG